MSSYWWIILLHVFVGFRTNILIKFSDWSIRHDVRLGTDLRNNEPQRQIIEKLIKQFGIKQKVYVSLNTVGVDTATTSSVKDNNVFILFGRKVSLNSFIGILGHELAHVALRHQEDGLIELKKKWRNEFYICFLLYLPYVLPRFFPKSEIASILAFGGFLIPFGYLFIGIFRGSKESWQQEIDADIFAAKTVGKDYVLAFLREAAEMPTQKSSERLPLALHPTCAQRIAEIERL